MNVRQISNYPAISASDGSETLLVQTGGLGGPYMSLNTGAMVSTALQSLPMSIGGYPPPDASSANLFVIQHVAPPYGNFTWNLYWDDDQSFHYWQAGVGATFNFANNNLSYEVTPPGSAGDMVKSFTNLMSINPAGSMFLFRGTLEVARDPAIPMEVATMGWVGNNTVARFNNRVGAVQLTGQDVYTALQLCDPIATQPWVISAINAGIGDLITTHPFVFSWNGRCGAVFLTLSDITCTFYQPGQQPVSPTPPITSNDDSIATTAWVTEYIANEFAGSGGNLATQTWVLANTVNSFNGRKGIVNLTAADVFDVGAAPLNSPNLSGVPTAPTAAQGQSTGQIATTAFVQQAIAHNTAGVSTFNTRTGDVVLSNADIVAAGGLANPSAALTGNPTAPTQPPGTNLPVLATCEFVTRAVAAGVTSFNTRTGAVVLQLTDITGVGGAPIVSPAFSSVPTAPTAAPGTNTVQLATCAFVTQAVTASGGVSSFNGRTGAVDLIGNDISAAGGLVNPSVNLTGTPTAPTATAGTNNQQIATTAFVTTAMSVGTVTSFNTRSGAVTLTGADISTAGGALLAGPAFTGAPTAPTPTAGTNNTQLATTQFVMSAILANTAAVTSFNTRTGAVTLTTADITAAGGAPSASPQFTGIPQAPTATAGTNTTQLATTQFVQTAIASSGVSSFNARTGAVTLISNDISAAGGALLAGPAFTGTPTAPTAAPGTNTNQLATTAFVQAGFLPTTGGTATGNINLTAPAVLSANQTIPGNIRDGLIGNQIVVGNSNSLEFNRYFTTTGASNNLAAGYSGLIYLDGSGVLNFSVNASAAAGAAVGTATGAFSLNQSNRLTVSGLTATGSVNLQAGATITNNDLSVNSPARIVANTIVMAPSGTVQIGNTGYSMDGGASYFAGQYTSASDSVNFYNNGSIGGTLVFSHTASGTVQQTRQLFSVPSSAYAVIQNVGDSTWYTWTIASSDRRIKRNIEPAGDALTIIENLPVYTADQVNRKTDEFEQHLDFTIIADEVEQVLPSAYIPPMPNYEEGIASLNWMPLVNALWRGVQQLSLKLTVAVERIEALEARMMEAGA